MMFTSSTREFVFSLLLLLIINYCSSTVLSGSSHADYDSAMQRLTRDLRSHRQSSHIAIRKINSDLSKLTLLVTRLMDRVSVTFLYCGLGKLVVSQKHKISAKQQP